MVCEGSVGGSVDCAGSLVRRVVCGSDGSPPVGSGRPSLGIGTPEGKTPGTRRESVAVGRAWDGSNGAPVIADGSREI